MKKAMIAMSGGVDSAVSALLTVEAGYEAVGVTLNLCHKKDAACGTLRDVEDARKIAEKLGIEHTVLDYTDDFRTEVIGNFIHSYETGETPNPCIVCNEKMKFGRLLSHATACGCDTLVTGHYARVVYDAEHDRYLLKKAVSAAKDQSYVLYFLSQAALSHLSFPLGEFSSKDEVRARAAAAGLVNAKKHDSQDICFIPDGDYVSFIREETGKNYPCGDFVDEEGRVLGRHKGQISYTIGQRKGLGVALGHPVYVSAKDAEKNTVTLSDEAALYRDTCFLRQVRFSYLPGIDTPLRLSVKPRYKAAETPATVYPPDADGYVRVVFDEPQRALTTGQAAVFYDGDTVIGGGIITKT